jgi:plasmid stabilization system protein ParE
VTCRIVLSIEAEQDIIDAYHWYDNQQVGLGDRFITEVRVGLDHISTFPQGCQRIERDYRRAVIKHFPFALIYEYLRENNTIVVFAVFDCRQDPAKWRERLV